MHDSQIRANMRARLTFLALSIVLPTGARAAENIPVQLEFNHKDWEIACDNTRTCRAAGYQDESLGPSASVLLTRRAGPNQPVLATLQLADQGDPKLQPGTVSMWIDGHALGSVELTGDHAGQLSRRQTRALLDALGSTRTIEWRAGQSTWAISPSGANAVLLKMDAFQGRLGTPGALIRKGIKHESAVLPALPRPVMQAIKPSAPGGSIGLSTDERSRLLAALRQSTNEDTCEKLHEDPA